MVHGGEVVAAAPADDHRRPRPRPRPRLEPSFRRQRLTSLLEERRDLAAPSYSSVPLLSRSDHGESTSPNLRVVASDGARSRSSRRIRPVQAPSSTSSVLRTTAPPFSYQKGIQGQTASKGDGAAHRDQSSRENSDRPTGSLDLSLGRIRSTFATSVMMRRSGEYLPAGRDDDDEIAHAFDDSSGSSRSRGRGSASGDDFLDESGSGSKSGTSDDGGGDDDDDHNGDRLRNQIIVVRLDNGGGPRRMSTLNRYSRRASANNNDEGELDDDDDDIGDGVRRNFSRDPDGNDHSTDEDDDDDEEAAGFAHEPPALSPTRRLWRLASSSFLGRQRDHDDYEPPGEGPAASGGAEASSSSLVARAVAATGLVLAIMTAALLWNRGYRLTSPANAQDPSGGGGDASCLQEGELARRFYAQSTLADLPNGAVASDHALCSQMGMEVLSTKGGNAVDAAVTVALCLGVANPGSSGLGGGAFMLIHADAPAISSGDGANLDGLRFDDVRDPSARVPSSASGKVTTVVDCREVAPGAATATMFDSQQTPLASLLGGLAVAVPGELRGLELAHRMHGRLPWRDVVEPVSRLATKGVEVNENLAHEIAYMASKLNSPDAVDFGLRSLLTRGDNWDNPLREKELLQNQRLGELLQAVADKGADALYVDMAESLADDIHGAGGIVTAHDIRNYRAILRSPVFASDVDGFTVVGIPPPSSGGAAIIGAARFLTGFSIPFATFADTLSVHLVSEALKHVYAIRMSLSDPAYNNETVKAAVFDLTRGSYISSLRNATLLNTTLPLSQYGGQRWAQLKDTDGSSNASDAQEGDRRWRRRKLLRPLGYLNDAGTSHFSIIDKEGNAVAMTTSVNTYFGSTVVSRSTGIVLGNTMDDFSSPGTSNYFGIRPSEANFIVPGKKPLSSMSPTMIFRNADGASLGELILVVGASGGPKIISAVLQVLALSLLQGSSLFESVVRPRIHDQLLYHGSAVTAVEDAILADGTPLVVSLRTQDALRRRNHKLVNVDYMGTVQAIAVDPETKYLTATCDVRKGGSPAGY